MLFVLILKMTIPLDIGLAPMSKHIYVATGFMGEGMVFGSLGGSIMAVCKTMFFCVTHTL